MIQSFMHRLRTLVGRARNFMQGGVFKLAGGAATGQAIGLAAYPVITRLYDPTHLGVLSVYASIVGIISVIGCLRIEQAIPMPRENAEALALAALSVVIGLGVASATMLAVLIRPEWFPGAIPEVSGIVSFLVPAGVLAIALYNMLNMLALREKQYGEVARTRVIQGASVALIQVGGGLIGGGAAALVAGHLGGSSAGATRLTALALRKYRSGLKALKLPHMLAMLQRYSKFIVVGAPSALLNSAGLLLGPILIAQHYGLQTAGFFGLAVSVLSVPVALVGRSNAQVFYAESSRTIGEEPAAVIRRLRGTTVNLTLLGVLPSLLIMLAGPQIFTIVFGQQWITAGDYSALLVFAYLLSAVSAPAAQAYLLVERQEISLVLNVVKLTAPIIGFVVLPLAGQGVMAAILVYTAVLSVYYLLVIVLAMVILKQYARRRWES